MKTRPPPVLGINMSATQRDSVVQKQCMSSRLWASCTATARLTENEDEKKFERNVQVALGWRVPHVMAAVARPGACHYGPCTTLICFRT